MDVLDKPPPQRPKLDVSMADLRESLAAPGCADEGTRGTLADKLKLKAASDADILRAITAALSTPGEEATHAAAVDLLLVCNVRSIAINPQAAVTVGKQVAPALCSVLRRQKDMILLAWALMALIRLAQHTETHQILRRAGAVPSLSLFTRPDQKSKLTVRLDLLASFGLAFLSASPSVEMRQEACSLVPLRTVPELVQLLRQRLQLSTDEVVDTRLFCGMPVDFRPRFAAQSLTLLCEASAAHAAIAWQSPLPTLLCEILTGELPNDAASNLPFGSPDVVEMSSRCRSALLFHAKKRSIAPPEALAALQRAPAAPKGTWAERGEVTSKASNPRPKSRL